MKQLAILTTACLLYMLPMTTQAQESEEFVMNLTEYSIKFGHNSNFTDGVKKWIKCYKDNNGNNTWRTWKRTQGKGDVYVVASRMDNWAEMGEDDDAGMACRPIALESIVPHIESRSFNTFKSMPKLSSKAELGDNTLVWVYGFDVNDRKAFNEVINEVSSALDKKEGDKRGYWYRSLAGDGGDYFVSTPYKDFAELDKDEDSVWEVYESVHGKSKTENIRAKFNTSVDHVTSFIYTLQAELSMN
ncbi:hypothetical protein [Winogradskyella flava]|uniref:Uncharacterized protein n=1 Tax=Winogradskyella flava TaxID=1884876 RepID=A0A842IV77_9FLAO|nr:hypothetical protein [Winogradskyella flava]MBC2845633.1 hypothetical protein [Winogradskyella flava]